MQLGSSPASATVTSGAARSRSHGGSPVPLDSMRLSPRSSPKAGPSSSPDMLYYQPDGAMPGTSKATETCTSASEAQYYPYEGPSTSSSSCFEVSRGCNSPRNRASGSHSPPQTVPSMAMSRSPQRTNSESVQPTSKSPESNYFNLINQHLGGEHIVLICGVMISLSHG